LSAETNEGEIMTETAEPRLPTIPEAILSLLSLVAGIGISIAFFGLDPQIPMLLGVGVAGLVAWRCGYGWSAIQSAMVGGITNALPAIMILLIIGTLIGVWILSGVVPALLYYGLTVLTPEIFLPTTLLICAITSLATGTSWGTTGTIGVALMGIGAGLGFPLPLVAGAVLSGAYFGDKMSPLSDTTNLAPAMAGTDLYTHIKHMSYTSGVAFGLTIIIEIVLGFVYSAGGADLAKISEILTTLDANFTINAVMLIPPLVVMVVSYRKVPALPGIALGVLTAAIIGFALQGNTYEQTMGVAFNGYKSETGVESVDSLLSRGGMSSMLYTISIVFVAMMFGGIMERTNQLRVLVAKILERAQSTASLITSTVLTTLAANLVLCDQYMSIVLGARTYAQSYHDRGLHAKNLSRVVEDSGTVTANLVPWNSGGAYQAGVLGVATLAYLPFAFFCWLSPLVTLAFGWFNITIHTIEDDPETQMLIDD
jgi:NhaC family Na+:H+ antiporter